MGAGQEQKTMLGEVEKAFAPKGILRLYRHKERYTFTCSRCHRQKTSKLAAFAESKSSEPLCNGCYGEVLA